MANEQNLTPFTSEQNREEAAKNGKKGGVASGEARRNRKLLREAIEIALDLEYADEDGVTMTGWEMMAARAVKAAFAGDWKAWELVRDTAGQKPVECIVTAEVPAEMVDEIEALVFGRSDDRSKNTNKFIPQMKPLEK